MIDLLSKGRVILGVGLGYHPDYFRLFGAPYNERFSRFERASRSCGSRGRSTSRSRSTASAISSKT